MDGAVAIVTSDAARAGRRAAPRRGAPRGGATRDARDVDGVAAMRDVRAFMSSRGWLWRRVAKPAEDDRKTSTTTRRSSVRGSRAFATNFVSSSRHTFSHDDASSDTTRRASSTLARRAFSSRVATTTTAIESDVERSNRRSGNHITSIHLEHFVVVLPRAGKVAEVGERVGDGAVHRLVLRVLRQDLDGLQRSNRGR